MLQKINDLCRTQVVRGTLAGALKKRLGLTIDSEKPEGKDRIYRITAGLETL